MTHQLVPAAPVPQVSRRGVLQATGLAAVATIVAGCGSTGDASGPAATSSTAAGGQALVEVAQVPVGGGVILDEPAIVVTQPADGTVKAFTAICPHQGCLVSEVVDGEILCPCHGSTFSIVDGSVIQGPAQEGLAAEPIAVRDGTVTLA